MPLTLLPGTLLLRSGRIVAHLLDWFGEAGTTAMPAIQNSLADEINTIYPNQFRLDDAERAVQLLKAAQESSSQAIKPPQSMQPLNLGYTFDFLEAWFEEFFEIDGISIQVKYGLEERYEALLARLHPATVVGYRLAKDLVRNRLQVRDMRTLRNATRNHCLRPAPAWQEYAENHLHLSGSYGSALVLMQHFSSQATPTEWYAPEILRKLPHVHDFSLLTQRLFSVGQLVDLAKLGRRLLLALELYPSEREQWQKVAKRLIQSVLATGQLRTLSLELPVLEIFDWLPVAEGSSARTLLALSRSFARNGESEAELLCYVTYLHWVVLRDGGDSFMGLLAKLQLQLMNLLRAFMVMGSNQGLSHFARYYDSILRDPTASNVPARDIMQACAVQAFDSGTTLLEGRITPSALHPSKFVPLVQVLEGQCSKQRDPATAQERRLSASNARADRRYHFLIHFLRNAEPADFPGKALRLPPRHARVRQRIRQEAVRIENFLYSQDWQNIHLWDLFLYGAGDKAPLFPDREKFQRQRMNITALLGGLDVAGIETHTPPEVYAPVIRALRRMPRWRENGDIVSLWPYAPLNFHPRLRLMVHAGEDFPHIIQGMRRIDETVQYYQMSQGDRLGHALAIGIDPTLWLQRQGEVILTEGEYLDNLVWVRHQTMELAMRVPRFAAHPILQENSLRQQCEAIFGRECRPEALFQAWLMRDRCPMNLAQPPELSLAIPVAGSTEENEQEVPPLLREYHFSPDVRRRYDSLRKTDRPDRIGLGDLELWEALQDMLMDHYSQKGITIETNPSSNVYIGPFQHYGEHPIFRWHPPDLRLLQPGGKYNQFGLRRSRMICTVNSDDPTIFPTNLHHELQLLKRAATKYFNVSEVEAEIWIDSLRQQGVSIYKSTEA
ncbi:MAG: hypothetical protein HQM05_10830 [Magnetococcales bacterium]|nr:hypothetical protein [Magnetococcales bacterium]